MPDSPSSLDDLAASAEAFYLKVDALEQTARPEAAKQNLPYVPPNWLDAELITQWLLAEIRWQKAAGLYNLGMCMMIAPSAEYASEINGHPEFELNDILMESAAGMRQARLLSAGAAIHRDERPVEERSRLN